jgi:hypothetical protein
VLLFGVVAGPAGPFEKRMHRGLDLLAGEPFHQLAGDGAIAAGMRIGRFVVVGRPNAIKCREKFSAGRRFRR